MHGASHGVVTPASLWLGDKDEPGKDAVFAEEGTEEGTEEDIELDDEEDDEDEEDDAD
jgi:hypothetical protein